MPKNTNINSRLFTLTIIDLRKKENQWKFEQDCLTLFNNKFTDPISVDFEWVGAILDENIIKQLNKCYTHNVY